MKSPPGLSCIVCSTCGHCSTSLWVGSTPKHPGGIKLSWIIQVRNGFEVKGDLQEEMVCCGCHHLGKGPFRGAGEAGGCAVGFPVVDCLLLNSTVHTPRTHCFLLCEGGGAWAGGAQEGSARSGAGHPAGVYGECGDVWVPQCPGTPQEWNCLSPCDGGASSRSWREWQCCGVGSASWALQPLPSAPSCTAGVAPHCSVPHYCPFLPRTLPNCILCLHLAFLSALGGGWLVVASLTALGRGAGDCQARVSDCQPGLFCGHTVGGRAWQEQAAHPELAVSPVPPPSLPRCQAGAPSCIHVQVSQGVTVTVTCCSREKRAEPR